MHSRAERRICGGFSLPRFLLAYSAGVLVLGLPWPGPATLPARVAVAGAAGLAVALCGALAAHRRGGAGIWLVWAGVPLGLVVGGLASQAALDARLHTPPRGATFTFTGRVISDPAPLASTRGPPGARFVALITSAVGPDGSRVAQRRVRLSWYGAPPLARGEVWRWTAVLKSPWSYADPGGFDYERWLLGAGLQGTGYVRSGERLQAAHPGPVARARLRLTTLISGLHLDNGGVLLALLIGRGSGISNRLWQVFRATGTVHLMVISGLHVSLVAALGFAIGRWAIGLCPWLPLWVHARAAGCATGLAAATGYVALAGGGVPALRSLLMSGATLALLAGGRTSRLGTGLVMALAACLTLQPLAVYQLGFWLSFGAVAILYLSLGHRHADGWWRSLLRAQLSMSLGMLPLVSMCTSTVPWTGVPANLVAVPVISAVVTPIGLIGGCLAAISDTAAGWLLIVADVITGLVLDWLRWLAQAPVVLPAGGTWALVLAQAGALCWLLGIPRSHLPALLLGWALPFAAQSSRLEPGQYRVMALDVGQGTAVVIDTARHRLLYDAGPAFPSGFETGSTVVVPSIAATGAPRLDMMILSHDDMDHVGGAPAVVARLAPARVIAPSATRIPSSERCVPQRWRWDGVWFRLVGVARPANASDNDRSCILLVSDGRRRTLLAGDISRRVEGGLIRALAPHELPVEVLFAPHHGSVTASSMALVRTLRPRIVVFTAGYGNRFGHPHPRVVARYRTIGARMLQTGRDGALIWCSADPHTVIRWRIDRRPYWRSTGAGGSVSMR